MQKYFFAFFLTLSCNLSFSQEKFELRAKVHEYLSLSNTNFNFAMLAEAYRGDTRIAFLWPCMIDSVLVDDKILAVAFEKQDGEWYSTDMFCSSSDTNMKKFIQVIGGPDYKVVKPDGVPVDSLGNFIHEKIRNAHMAILNKENEKAILEIEEFSRAFGLKSCAFSTLLSEYIMRGAKILDVSEIKISQVVTEGFNGSAILDVYFPKEAKSNAVQLIKIGNGWAIDGIK